MSGASPRLKRSERERSARCNIAYCFIGNEAYTWTLADFATSAHTIAANGYDTVVFKAGEGQSNLWYSDTDFQARYQFFQQAGLHPIPYVFLYGNSQGSDVASEAKICNHIISLCGEICLDMESGWDGKPQDAQALVKLLNKGMIHISTWANIVDHQWVDVLKALTPIAASVWPQVYTSYLAGVWQAQYAGVSLPVYPTYAQATMPNTLPESFGYWELATIQTTKETPMQLNGSGCVCDTTRWYQLETEQLPNVPGSPQGTYESEDLCGPGGVIITALSNEPNKGRLVYNGAQVDAEYIDRATDDMVDAYGKAHSDAFTHINWPGSDDSDMIWFLNYARDKYQRTHYQVIASPTIDRIRTAVRAGYPVLFSCNELDIQEKRTGARPPYPWHLSAGHIITVTGIDKDGDFICPDILNNGFQNSWPVTYVASVLANSLDWACIIKLPFLANIPSGDPLGSEWKNFNAQNFGGIQPMNWPSQGMQQQAQDTWLISAKFLQAAFASTAPYTTGIALAWQDKYKQGKNYGPPVCTEINSVDWNNKPVKVQLFAAGVRAEWDGTCHWFDKDGPLS